MSSPAHVTIHESQFPEKVRRDLLASLRTRRVNHKFHYDSVKQTQKWLALHQTYAPSRRDGDCRAIYEKGFEAAAARIAKKSAHVIGLGCGGGQKDTRLLKRLKTGGRKVFYTPCDVSTAMVLTARQAALGIVPDRNCFPFVGDLLGLKEMRDVTASPVGSARIVTFFGMIPNFEPEVIFPKLASLIGPEDILLFSANLAPGNNYDDGVKRVLPQYDNEATRDWLETFLFDLGVEDGDGKLRFGIETMRNGLKRITAHFYFSRTKQIEIEERRFRFKAGDRIRLFFSYRYTPALIRKWLSKHGLQVRQQWITASGEEGVFFCSPFDSQNRRGNLREA